MSLRSLVSYPAIIFKDQVNLNFFILTVTTLSGHTDYNHVNTTMKKNTNCGRTGRVVEQRRSDSEDRDKSRRGRCVTDIKTARKDTEDVPAVWVFCSQLWCCVISKQFNKSWWIPPGSGPVSERSNNNQQLFCPEPAGSVSTVVTSAGRFLPPSRSSPLTDDLTTSRSTRSASSITLIASLIRSVLPSRFRTAALFIPPPPLSFLCFPFLSRQLLPLPVTSDSFPLFF